MRVDLEDIDYIVFEFLVEWICGVNFSLVEVVGKIGVENYFDEIFLLFCIGK